MLCCVRMDQQHHENNRKRLELWSPSDLSNSMEDISDLLDALSEDMDKDFDIVGAPLPSVPVDDNPLTTKIVVTSADPSTKEVVIDGSNEKEEEEEEEEHRVRRRNHCQRRVDVHCNAAAGQSAGTRTEKRDHRNRTTEMHKVNERRRREKIKRKLRELQQLVPNSDNMDRASMLEEAIRYIKYLQQGVKAVSTSGRGVPFQPPLFIQQPLQPGVQYMRWPSYPQFIPINVNMNMVGMNCTVVPPLEPNRHPPSTGLLPIVLPSQPGRFSAPPAFLSTSVPSPVEISNQVGTSEK